ncbi:TRIM56 [Mytilus edulis]|uniref:TRIM56 n=1 Tax=Mytilus edulis TaxID=6550 RepID=A0A8S3RX83_MYTED|nr:TRIM56 [Mytilus edulis]
MGRNKNGKLTQFSCPVCKSVVKPKDDKGAIEEWSAALQNNLILSIMIARNKEDKEQDCVACKRHQQQSVAKFWCKECDETFCDKCNTMHSWVKLSLHILWLRLKNWNLIHPESTYMRSQNYAICTQQITSKLFVSITNNYVVFSVSPCTIAAAKTLNRLKK